MGLFDFLKGRNKTNQTAPSAGGAITPANLEAPEEGTTNANANNPTPVQPPLPPQENGTPVPPTENNSEPKA